MVFSSAGTASFAGVEAAALRLCLGPAAPKSGCALPVAMWLCFGVGSSTSVAASVLETWSDTGVRWCRCLLVEGRGMDGTCLTQSLVACCLTGTRSSLSELSGVDMTGSDGVVFFW